MNSEHPKFNMVVLLTRHFRIESACIYEKRQYTPNKQPLLYKERVYAILRILRSSRKPLCHARGIGNYKLTTHLDRAREFISNRSGERKDYTVG